MAKKNTALPAFKAWLTECGAVLEPTTNEWEIVRVRTLEGVFVAYRDKAGHETWPKGLADYMKAFCDGKFLALSPLLTKRRQLTRFIEPIAQRDGLE